MITLTKDQAARLDENGTLTIVRPLVQQPPEGYVYKGMLSGVVYFDYIGCVSHGIKLQFPVGKSVKCKSTTKLDVGTYSGDGIDDSACNFKCLFHTTVTANRVCRVQEVLVAEWINTGFDTSTIEVGLWNGGDLHEIKDYFNSLYAKPRLRTVDGKQQYVAWAWYWESWEQSYGQNDKYEEYSYNGVLCQYWDKLKITVYCKPFVEIVTVNTEEN